MRRHHELRASTHPQLDDGERLHVAARPVRVLGQVGGLRRVHRRRDRSWCLPSFITRCRCGIGWLLRLRLRCWLPAGCLGAVQPLLALRAGGRTTGGSTTAEAHEHAVRRIRWQCALACLMARCESATMASNETAAWARRCAASSSSELLPEDEEELLGDGISQCVCVGLGTKGGPGGRGACGSTHVVQHSSALTRSSGGRAWGRSHPGGCYVWRPMYQGVTVLARCLLSRLWWSGPLSATWRRRPPSTPWWQ